LSPSNLLLYLGLFDPMIKGFKSADLGVFIPMAVGGLITLVLFSKIMHYLLQNFHAKVYHFILGIVVVSTLLIVIPPVADYSGFTIVSMLISTFLFAIGVWLGYWMSHLEQKYK